MGTGTRRTRDRMRGRPRHRRTARPRGSRCPTAAAATRTRVARAGGSRASGRIRRSLLRGPAAQPEAPAGSQHPEKLRGDDRMAPSEHAAECREHDVEALVGERKRLRVVFSPLDRDAGLGGQHPAGCEKLGGEVDAGRRGARLRRADGRVARSARNVDDLVTGRNAHPAHDLGADVPEGPRHGLVVAGGPRRTGTPLQFGELDRLPRGHLRRHADAPSVVGRSIATVPGATLRARAAGRHPCMHPSGTCRMQDRRVWATLVARGARQRRDGSTRPPLNACAVAAARAALPLTPSFS